MLNSFYSFNKKDGNGYSLGMSSLMEATL